VFEASAIHYGGHPLDMLYPRSIEPQDSK
jgi:hypothetical protein